MRSLDDLGAQVRALSKDYHAAAKDQEKTAKELEDAGKYLKAVEEAQQVLQTVAQHVQKQAHEKIASVVTRCIEAVFDDPYQFKILFEKKRGRTEARLAFVRRGEEEDPEDVGGSVIDVASLALRLVLMTLHRPKLRRLIVLDEPFRFLDPDNQEKIPAMLETLSKELDVQFVIVTNIPAVATGRVIRIK